MENIWQEAGGEKRDSGWHAAAKWTQTFGGIRDMAASLAKDMQSSCGFP